MNALMHAAATGSAQATPVLLAEQPPLDARDARGWTALHHAAAGGSIQVIQALVRAGAKLSPADVAAGAELLSAAAEVSGDNQVLKMSVIHVMASSWWHEAGPSRSRAGAGRPAHGLVWSIRALWACLVTIRRCYKNIV